MKTFTVKYNEKEIEVKARTMKAACKQIAKQNNLTDGYLKVRETGKTNSWLSYLVNSEYLF